MNKNRILSTGLGFAATLSLFACGPQPGVVTPPTSSPTATPSASSSPIASPSPSSSPTASPLPSESPSASPLPTASPTSSPLPNASPTLPPAGQDIAIIEKTTFNGKVFDDTFSPLDGVTVKAKSLNASIPYEVTTVTAGGTYAFNNAPAGIQLEISSSKAGFTTRKRVEVLKSNKQGDPNANRYDFGTDGGAATFSAAYNALSDKPEVVMVTPSRNASGIDPKTSFVLKFSEPMDKKTAEDTFTVRSFNNRKMTVDSGNLRIAGGANTVAGNGTIATNFLGTTATKIWDKDAFNISWNSDDTEVTFSFKEEKLLPTDKDSNLVPDYNVAFNGFNSGDRLLKDKSGISRSDKHFKLTDGDFEESYKFSIKTDEVKPTITGITAETAENGGQNGDAVRVRYSERMIIYTRDISIAGGMENIAGADQKAPAGYPGTAQVASTSASAKNYNITTVQTGGVTTYTGTWGALGGTAVYDTTDLTHKTVLLLPGFSSGTFTHVAATAANDTLTGTAVLGDGTSVAVTSANIAGANYAQIQTALNAIAGLAGGTFTVTGSAAASAANTTYNITLGAGATLGGAAPAKSIRYITFTGGTNASNMGISATTPYNVYPGVTAGTRMNLYVPGDTVRVKVNSTVLDPAGNTLDSSRDNASANAS
ncbi:MAG: carboxypeptidase regulatory-like domain-containing protein [Candidatus Sericytochromatia bacterium]|nr:carboxypeptidase regulatory-like domain-containing protein [Candidatus Sericytochromatia bacterium]